MKKYFFAVLLLFLIVANTFSQGNFPENGELYIDTVVPRIDITIDPDTLAWIYNNVDSDIEFHAKFVFDNGNVRDTIDPVGFRLRGNTSRLSQKKSFKVSFNTWTSGGKYYGVEKMNLNGEHNDPSIMRSKISWDILRKMGIPAPRANHVQVYINDNYYGLYINVEHIDEEFAQSRFNYNDGNLFKCLYPADLDYLGDDPDLYKLMSGDRRVYELKTNKEADNYTDLAEFIDVLNNTSNQDLKCELNEKFNVYDYLKVIAFDILTSDWDGYIYNKNNFYLYHNTTTDKFEYVVYDVDNTYGIDWFGIDWGTRNMYSWDMGNGEQRPLYTKLMNNAEFRSQYTYYMKKLVYNDIDLDSLGQAILARRSMILPYVTNDPYYPLDYGYTVTDFLNSYTQAIGEHVPYGIIPFLETRIESIKSQLENTSMVPIVKYIKNERESSTEIWFTAYGEDDQAGLQMQVQYAVDGGETNFKEMFDDGNHHDDIAGDKIYGASIELPDENSAMSYQIIATDSQNFTQLMPCTPIDIPAAGNDMPLLFINEFMADNDGINADGNGDYDDWLEIYNADSETVWLGNKFLTDNLTDPTKWQMPDYYVAPGEFLLIWADDETDEGIFHANFKLSKGGEEIGIFNEGGIAIDQYIFGEQTTDISEGRFHDGEDNWIFFEQPTPGASNLFASIEVLQDSDRLKVYPNPSSTGVVFLNKATSLTVYNSTGMKMGEFRNTRKLDLSQFPKGLYIVVLNSGEKTKLLLQ
jgi:spore coat protein CotH